MLLAILGVIDSPAAAQQGGITFTIPSDTTSDVCRGAAQNLLAVLNNRASGLTISPPNAGSVKFRSQVTGTQQGTQFQALLDQWDRAVRDLRGICGCPSDTWLPRERTVNAAKEAIDNFLNDVEYTRLQQNNRFGLILRPRTEHADSNCPELPTGMLPAPLEVATQAVAQGGVAGVTATPPSAATSPPRAAATPAAAGVQLPSDPLGQLRELIINGQIDGLSRIVQLENSVSERLDSLGQEIASRNAQQWSSGDQMVNQGLVGLLIGAAAGATIIGIIGAAYLGAGRRQGALSKAMDRLADDLHAAVVRQDMTLRELTSTLAGHGELLRSLVEQAAQRTPSAQAVAGLEGLPTPRRNTALEWPETSSRALDTYSSARTERVAADNEAAILQHYNELVAGCGRDCDEASFVAAFNACWAVAETASSLRLIQNSPPRGSLAFLVVEADGSRVLIYPAVSFRQTWAGVAGTPAADTVFEGVFVPLHGSGRYRVVSAARGKVEGSSIQIEKAGTVEI